MPRLIWIYRIQWWCILFQFLTGKNFLDKFGPKSQNCLSKVEFNAKTNLNMQNSMVVSILSVPDWK